MTEENRPHEEGGTRSGGPGPILPVDPVIAPMLASEPCECREAVLLRMIASGELPVPQTVGFKTLAGIVRAATIQKLRQISNAMSCPNDPDRWARASHRSSYEDLEQLRNTFEVPEWAVAANAMLARRRGESA
jgi:hypothetical protein